LAFQKRLKKLGTVFATFQRFDLQECKNVFFQKKNEIHTEKMRLRQRMKKYQGNKSLNIKILLTLPFIFKNNKLLVTT